MQFSKDSLDSLATNLEDTDCKYLLSEFPPDKLEILSKKDPYPYEWVDDYRKFNYPSVPPDDAFYSRLNSNKRGKSKVYIYISQKKNTLTLIMHDKHLILNKTFIFIILKKMCYY